MNREDGVTENYVLSNATRDEGNQAKRDLASNVQFFQYLLVFFRLMVCFFPND